MVNLITAMADFVNQTTGWQHVAAVGSVTAMFLVVSFFFYVLWSVIFEAVEGTLLD